MCMYISLEGTLGRRFRKIISSVRRQWSVGRHCSVSLVY